MTYVVFCFIALCLISYQLGLAISSRCTSVVGIQGKESGFGFGNVIREGIGLSGGSVLIVFGEGCSTCVGF